MSREAARVRDLPVKTPLEPDQLQARTPIYHRGEPPFLLHPGQAQTLLEMAQSGGAMAGLKCGEGKTLVACLAPWVLQAQTALILVPAGVRNQFRRMWAAYRREGWKVKTNVDIHSYHALSSRQMASLLEDIRPDLIILDEAHKLRHQKTARWRRFQAYLDAHPDTKLVCLSGSFTTSSVSEYAHLAAYSLRDGSPLPRDPYTAAAWGRVLDVDGVPLPSDWRAIRPISQAKTQKEARRDYRDRLRATCGWIPGSEDKELVGASLRIVERRDIERPPELVALYDQCKASETDPDGVPFISDAEKARCLKGLSLGFWYRHIWPNGEPDEEWLLKRSAWSKVRSRLLDHHAAPGFDSAKLVEERIVQEFGLQERLRDPDSDFEDLPYAVQCLAEWKAIERLSGFQTEPVWEDTSILTTLLEELMKRGEPTLVWYRSRRAFEALNLSMLGAVLSDDLDLWSSDVAFYPAGSELPERPESLVSFVSLQGHGTGLELQHGWSRNLVLEPPSSAQMWEQFLSRTHRTGQRAPEVLFEVLQHTQVLRWAMVQARRQARDYIEESTGSLQRLSYADVEVRR